MNLRITAYAFTPYALRRYAFTPYAFVLTRHTSCHRVDTPHAILKVRVSTDEKTLMLWFEHVMNLRITA